MLQIQAPFTSPSSVDPDRFAALERRVEALVVQLQQLGPSPAIPRGSSPRLSNDHIPTAPGLALPITPVISEQGIPSPISSGSLETPATSSEQESAAAFENPSAKLALQVLNIIQRYGQNVAPHDAPWAGKMKFLPFVEEYVKNNKPVKMVLPAFPFKSPNRKDKVLGMLPDLGEELALMHLNGLCESIAEIYEHGATVTIVSDGLVYNGKSQTIDSECS
jgi:Pyoverdine/dityrosine biosynthesis protein